MQRRSKWRQLAWLVGAWPLEGLGDAARLQTLVDNEECSACRFEAYRTLLHDIDANLFFVDPPAREIPKRLLGRIERSLLLRVTDMDALVF